MRITVDLSNFFHDHRSLTKIFINKNLKTIEDVETHISNLFHIYNFYLTCENHYLPPGEQVHILHCNDIICVIPQTVNEENKRKKKENKGIRDENKTDKEATKTEESEANLIDNTICANVSKRKKKQKKQELKTVSARNLSNFTGENNTSAPELRNVCNKKETTLEELTDNLMDYKIYPNVCKRRKQQESKNVNGESDTPTPEIKNNVKKQTPFLSFNSDKRINIVKTIIISNGTQKESTRNLEQTTNGDVSNVSEEDLPSPILAKTPEVLSSPFATPTPSGLPSDTSDVSLKKRKRKRTHRRNRSETGSVVMDSTFQLCSPILTTPNPQHKRFGEEIEEKEVIVVNESIEKEKTEIVTLTPSLEGMAEKEQGFQKAILNQPIMENIEPKVDDTIAFKILRITENYTPEVSDYIVGKVLNYWPENKDITFEILYGAEHCLQPQGKFSIAGEEDEDMKTNNFTCKWSDVLQPRLLYP